MAEFAQIQNKVLSKNGFSIRVDHRSLKVPKEDTERTGGIFLARMLNRVPEKYIGIISCQDDDDTQLANLKEFRTFRQQHFDTVLKLDSMAKDLAELETRDAVQSASGKSKKLIDSEDFAAQDFESTNLQALQANLFTAIAEVNKWKRVIISQRDAEEQAKLEYMTKSEREICQNYSDNVAQIHNFEEFLLSLRQPKVSQADALKVYDDIVVGVKKLLLLTLLPDFWKKYFARYSSDFAR